MKYFITIFALFLSTQASAQSYYSQFLDIWGQGDRPAKLEDLRRIDNCVMVSDGSPTTLLDLNFRNYREKVDLGPVLGIKDLENFEFSTSMVLSLKINDDRFSSNESRGALRFIRKDSLEKASFRFGHKGQEIVLFLFEIDIYSGNDPFGIPEYHTDYILGQCRLRP